MRSQFDKQLAQLHRELIEMGALCEQVIALSSQALTNRDTALAEKVAPLDHEIDRKERDIENLCLRLLLQQQPVAGDLRQISAALKMMSFFIIRTPFPSSVYAIFHGSGLMKLKYNFHFFPAAPRFHRYCLHTSTAGQTCIVSPPAASAETD